MLSQLRARGNRWCGNRVSACQRRHRLRILNRLTWLKSWHLPRPPILLLIRHYQPFKETLDSSQPMPQEGHQRKAEKQEKGRKRKRTNEAYPELVGRERVEWFPPKIFFTSPLMGLLAWFLGFSNFSSFFLYNFVLFWKLFVYTLVKIDNHYIILKAFFFSLNISEN